MSMMLVLLLGMAGCSSSQQEQTKQAEVHVCVDGSDDSGKGTPNEPYATVSAAAEAAPGSVIIVHEGEYGPIRLGSECSGRAEAPTIVRPAEGEKVVVPDEEQMALYHS